MFNFIKFGEATEYPVAILIKDNALNETRIREHYIQPLKERGINVDNFIAIGLPYDNAKKVTSKFGKEFLSKLLPQLTKLKTRVVYCTDGNYLKMLVKAPKVDSTYGYALACKIDKSELVVFSSVNYQALFMNERLQEKIDIANKAITAFLKGEYKEPGADIIHTCEYIYTVGEAQVALQKLHDYPRIFADTETFSLRHTRAGLGTIAFSWDMHNGICINVQHKRTSPEYEQQIKQLLKEFFENYKGQIVWHNAAYDLKVLIYWLWMSDMLDQPGLQTGLEVMMRHVEDTRLITYLATNTCAENPLDLKSLSHEYTGNYAVNVKNIAAVSSDKLMKYNLIDCLATAYVHGKYYPIMVADNQEHVYMDLFKPMLKNVIQMEMTGIPINITRAKEVDKILLDMILEAWGVLNNSPLIKQFVKILKQQAADKKNKILKTKQVTAEDMKITFNPDSGPQLIKLIHDFMGFEVLDTTDTGLPAVGGDQLKGHAARGNDEQRKVLEAIIDVQDGNKIRNTFIAKFLAAEQGPDGWHYIFPGFNIGGTKSGRLSSSGEINGQNIPNGSKQGKLVKSCVEAPPGWLFVGLDFASLEDRINTLLTQDPNKVKVYTDGYCGHSLRAYSYFKEQLPDIEDTVESINSIADKYPELRQKSKAPTFALTYLGTPFTLEVNCGFSKEEAKQIYDRYHELYKQSDEWLDSKIKEAAEKGYAELAFGLRIRCPTLKKTVLGSRFTPYQAEAEKRTMGNAIGGQSYGMLNSRAGVEFQERTLNSIHRYDIKPVAHIHQWWM